MTELEPRAGEELERQLDRFVRARFTWVGLGSSRTRTKRSSCRSSSSPARGSSSVIQSSFTG